jgi:hypothetical protein
MVGKTPAALYERQRVLVEAGLLQAVAGRGPGTGVRATPQSMAVLLIALLATDSVAETGERTKTVMKLKSHEGPCPITLQKTFSAALAEILASEELAKDIGLIAVERTHEKVGASIWRKLKRSPGVLPNWAELDFSTFGFWPDPDPTPSPKGMYTRTGLRLPFDEIAHALAGTETKEPNK